MEKDKLSKINLDSLKNLKKERKFTEEQDEFITKYHSLINEQIEKSKEFLKEEVAVYPDHTESINLERYRIHFLGILKEKLSTDKESLLNSIEFLYKNEKSRPKSISNSVNIDNFIFNACEDVKKLINESF